MTEDDMQGYTYRAQLQEQHQEGGAPEPTTGNPADGPVPDGFGDDDIISDLLGGNKGRPKDLDPDEAQREEEPEPETPPDDDPAEAPEPEEEEELEEAAEADDPIEGSLEEARAARKAGDLDKACMIAFGCKPEQLAPTAYDWTKWRGANDKAQRAITKRTQEVEGTHQGNQQWVQQQRQQIHNIIEQLRPYEEVQLGLQAFDRDGDPEPLVRLVEKATKMSWADFNKAALTKTRRSPQERQMAQRMAELEQRLQATQAEREKQTQQQTQQQTYAADIAHIRTQVSGDVAKVPKFAERIYSILVKTRSAVGLTKTIDEAARMVLRAERKRIESHPFVRKPEKGGKAPPAVSAAARTLAARSAGKNRPPLRRDSQNNGAPNRTAETDDDIISELLAKRPARRAG